MKKYIVALTAICTLFLSACTSQLDIPQKGVVAYETYYTTDESAEAALVNVYAKMVQNVYGSIGNWNPVIYFPRPVSLPWFILKKHFRNCRRMGRKDW